MQTALHFKAQVLPGNKVEIHSPKLSEGDPVDIFVNREINIGKLK